MFEKSCPRCGAEKLRGGQCADPDCGFMTHRQYAIITCSGTPGLNYGEPRAELEDGREMPMGWNSGQSIPVGTRGVATYIATGHASLWQFSHSQIDNKKEPTSNVRY